MIFAYLNISKKSLLNTIFNRKNNYFNIKEIK